MKLTLKITESSVLLPQAFATVNYSVRDNAEQPPSELTINIINDSSKGKHANSYAKITIDFKEAIKLACRLLELTGESELEPIFDEGL